MNYLTTKLLILPQLQFFHLSRMLPVLFPLLFENGDRDFCLFAILTINFLNRIHVDEKDDLGPSVDRDLTEELQSLLHCPHLNESQKVEIKSSIALIEKYGAANSEEASIAAEFITAWSSFKVSAPSPDIDPLLLKMLGG
mmetsp:Transcript_30419/g.47647  ORF Transcript_30419/g.47647 Transcript_30419/m.47647 type:complete len:140 (+) Transcript_30419:374-793(+)